MKQGTFKLNGSKPRVKKHNQMNVNNNPLPLKGCIVLGKPPWLSQVDLILRINIPHSGSCQA